MKRTIVVSGLWLLWVCGAASAQGPAAKSPARAQVDPVGDVAKAVADAEKALGSVRSKLTGRSRMPGGLDVTTSGELRVLRGTQAEGQQEPSAPQLYSRLEYSFGEGMGGSLEVAQTSAGVLMFEANPAFGAVLLRFSPATVADLEWAGRVLERADLPGMADSRARSPLGSEMLVELQRTFDFTVEAGEDRGLRGSWLRGKRKPGLDDQDPDLPLADRVEVFVGSAPRAVRTVRHFVGEDVVQELLVTELEGNVELGEQAFVIDTHDLSPRDVQSYQPMWEQVEQTLLRAAAKSGQLRPSGRQHGTERPLGELTIAGRTFRIVQHGRLKLGNETAFEAFADGLTIADIKQLDAWLWIEAADGTPLSPQEKGLPGGDRLHFRSTPRQGDAAPARVVMRLRQDGGDERASLPVDLHDYEGVEGPHGGIAAKFVGGDRKGHLELKLHGGEGKLELWLATDDKFSAPFDLPLDATVVIEFADAGGRKVTMRPRNPSQNQDEDGKPNVRDGKTNYFVHPSRDGENASWLQGKDFQATVTVRFVSGGQTFTSESFEVRPSTR